MTPVALRLHRQHSFSVSADHSIECLAKILLQVIEVLPVPRSRDAEKCALCQAEGKCTKDSSDAVSRGVIQHITRNVG